MRRSVLDHLSLENDLSAADRIRADDRSHEFCPSCTDKSGKSKHFAFSENEGILFHIVGRNIFYFQENLSDLFVPVEIFVDISEITSDHHPDHLRFRDLTGLYCRHIMTILEDRHFVGDPPDLFHSVRYIDDDLAFRFQLFDDLKQSIDL